MNVTIDFNKTNGRMKPMHAVNNGPMGSRSIEGYNNFECFKEAGIPYARNHDASFHTCYGSEYTVDVHRIFRNFDADPTDPANYDFECTDKCVADTFSVGTEVYYRLGARIEHGKKVGTFPPADFHKWAVICEHIIRHYNEGWANGFEYGIKYWEIWNEPDCGDADGTNPCWQGTEEEFYSLFETTAKHLKRCFPHLKIGGPASAGDESWMARFLERMRKTDTPLDFFSYHWYWTQPKDMTAKCTRVRALLDKYGYKDTETHLNEWNYVRGWDKDFVYSIKQIIGAKGAAFDMACMCAAQSCADVDMLMYYDARPSEWNGLFDFYSMEPIKGYYSFYSFANLYDMGTQVEASSDSDDIYVISAKGNGKHAIALSYYTEDDSKGANDVTIYLDGVEIKETKAYLTDSNNTYAEIYLDASDNKINIHLQRNTVVYFEF